MFKENPYDIPFDEDSASKFIPWIIALTTFISTVFILSTLSLSSLAGKWGQDLGEHMTIQIPFGAQSEQDLSALNELLSHLRLLPSIARADIVESEETYKLLEPWLGQNVRELGLPIPTMIAVQVGKKQLIDAQSISNDLNKIVPGITITHHQNWHGQLIKLISTTQITIHIIVALIALAALGTLVFTTYTGLVVHKDIIHILRLMGARATYIANQFQRHTFKLALKGVFYNFLALGLMSLGVKFFLGQMDIHLPMVAVSVPLSACVLLLVPMAVVTAMILTSRLTVSYVLKQHL
jgi:cell division transport system permease protein